MMITLILVVGCSGNPPPPVSTPLAPQSPELRQVEAIIQAWNERVDLPPLDSAKLRQMRVIDPLTRAEYDELCPAGNGCTHGRNECSWPWCGRSFYAVVAPTYPDGRPVTSGSRLSLIRHEAVHFASDIAGMGSDAAHRDPRVWPYSCSEDRMRIPEAQRPPPSPEELACRAPTVEERARSLANGLVPWP